MFDEQFEAWYDENFPSMNDPITRAVARCAWDARWELVIKEFAENKKESLK